MYVIGTAGHVDHGKSTLVEALTGIDPDRLSEEKAREMTIDLGFAWLKFDGLEEEVGVVDVPGHRDFIENMLAGVGGIDLALFVIAADEGVMPQTSEHLAILDLLKVKQGIVVLTKIDMVEDPDWVELVTLDIAENLEGTVLEDAPIVPVSAKVGTGMNELTAMLVEKLATSTPRSDNGRPRLPIDRVFSLSGFGTIVTGTLIDGQLRIGDPIEIQPSGLTGRVRGLQSHKTKREVAQPGSRVAVNISGIDKDQLQRGDVLAGAEVVRDTILLDTGYRQLPTADAPLKHNMEVKLFVGAAEVLARTRVLGQPEIRPGESGWVQFALREPVAVLRGDRFIVRRPSPAATIGGGSVLDPHPGRQHRRFREDVIERLKTLEQGTPGDLLLQKLRRTEPANINKFQRQAGLDEREFQEALAELLEDKRAIRLEQQLLSRALYQQLVGEMQSLVTRYHKQHPLRLGMPREELRSRLKVTAAVFNPIVAQTELVDEGAFVRTANHSVTFSDAQQQKIDRLLKRFAQSGISSPSVKDAQAAVGEDVYFALVDLGQLRPLSDSVVYASAEYNQFMQKIVDFIRANGQITAGEVRDLLGTSRKYAIAFLEHLDHQKITRRVGDARELLKTDVSFD